MKTKYFLSLFLLFNNIIFGGFLAGTLVKTPNGFTKIENLKIGDTIEAYNFNKSIPRKVIFTKSKIKPQYIHICLENKNISTSIDQLFYLPLEGIWKKACNLQINEIIAKNETFSAKILKINLIQKKIKTFDISVETPHNFYIYSEKILAHNFLPIAIGFTWAFGAGALEFIGATAALCTLGGAIGIYIQKNNNDSSTKKPNISNFSIGFGGNPDPNDNKKNKIKIFEKNVKHIFRNAPGHLSDTPANRSLLIKVASNIKNFSGVDKYGNKWFSKILKSGKQVWVSVRNNLIRNGGINNSPKTFNSQTGLNKL